MLKHLVIHPATLTGLLHVLIVVTLSLRIIMKRPATGIALAWLLLIACLPFAGAVLYLLIGERRIGRSRARGISALRRDYHKLADAAFPQGIPQVDWSRHDPAASGLNQLGDRMVGISTLHGSDFDMYRDTEKILETLVRDIDAAEKSVLMEFYIWNAGGRGDDVLEAVIRAAERGVTCCLLIDALGARPWWKGKQPRRLREAGVEVRPALPVGLFRTLIGRTDLRLHRKIVILDGKAAWTGSMNLVDPRFFKQNSGVGEWVDAMVRVEGAVVVPLAATLAGDWMLETGEPVEKFVGRTGLGEVTSTGTADVQVIPSGPGETGDGLLQMILGLINAARKELVLTTPYLVPDDSLLRALRGASGRGVNVRLIVPEKVDSAMTRYASRSYYDDLLDVGVEIYLYKGGLLHTKSIMVDGAMSMFGTVNLDMRSFWLNYEVALFVYDRHFADQLGQLQQSYIDDADRLDAAVWAKRSFSNRLLENSLRLMSPLL